MGPVAVRQTFRRADACNIDMDREEKLSIDAMDLKERASKEIHGPLNVFEVSVAEAVVLEAGAIWQQVNEYRLKTSGELRVLRWRLDEARRVLAIIAVGLDPEIDLDPEVPAVL